MSIEGWPFLVGRNKALPYQVIVSPQFLAEQALSYVLEHVVITEDNPLGSATLREIHGTSAGDIRVIFRTFRPHAQNVGLEGTASLTDKVGRLIPLVEGLVVRGIDQTQDIILTQEDLQIAHDKVMQAYRAFWQEDTHFPEQVSQPFDLHTPNKASKQVTLSVVPPLVIPTQKAPLPTPRKRSKFLLYATTVTIMVLVVLSSVLFFYHSNLSSSIEPTATSTTIVDNNYNYTQVTSKPPKLTDPLRDNSKNNGWDEYDNCVFSDGAYHVKNGEPQQRQKDTFQICEAHGRTFSNFAFQVQMTIINGSYGGIVFGINQENPLGNRFAFHSDKASSDLTYGNKTVRFTTNQAHSNQTYLLTVIVRDSSISLYIDRQLLATAQGSPASSGEIGLLGRDYSHNGDVAFSNVQVWNL